MYDIIMLAFSAMSGICALIAVIVAIVIYKRQKRIALFERRAQILNDFENFVFLVLPDWDWNGNISKVKKYSEREIESLFDSGMVDLQNEILKSAESCNKIIGDIHYAKRHGTCNGKTESELEKEKEMIEEKIGELFTTKRAKANDKWLKL